jgi:hypothetical protein
LIIYQLKFSETFKPAILIRSGGGIYNYLYQLKSSLDDSAQTKVEGNNVLGKLQITWRTNLGEPGRLQTQQILGTVSVFSFIMMMIDRRMNHLVCCNLVKYQ